MHSLLPLPQFASLLGVGLPEIVIFAIPIAGMVFGGVMGITAMYFKHQKQKLWHETTRLALEKGQPLPEYPAGRGYRGPGHLPDLDKHDLRAGLILMGIGAALYMFLGGVAGDRVAFVGAIPGFIGVALVLHWLLTRIFAGKKDQSPPPPS